MPVINSTLKLDQGTSPVISVCWIAGGIGVNPSGSTATCLFRQTASDSPLLTITSTSATSNGSIITYAVPLNNVPVYVQDIDEVVDLVLYPIIISISVADMALLIFPWMKAKMNLTWPSDPLGILPSISLDEVHWDVEISNV